MTGVRGCWSATADFLVAAGVRTVFGLPSDDLDALRDLSAAGVRMIVCRDQRNAVHMANGYAQQSGSVGVCVVGKGPAVANTVTGLLEAASSRTPVLLLATGTAPDRRHSGAFQDADQLAMVASVVKRTFRVDDPDRIPAVLQLAWAAATGGAPGPVYVEFGEQLLEAGIEVPPRWGLAVESSVAHTVEPDSAALALIETARRPVVLVGGGARRAAAGPAVTALAERLGAAILCTASGRGTVDEAHPLFLGVAGLYCPEPVRELLAHADLVISAGSRLEETAATGAPLGEKPPPVVQINVERADFSFEVSGPLVLGDVGQVVQAWRRALRTRREEDPDPAWISSIARTRARLFDGAAAVLDNRRGSPTLHVAELLAAVREEWGTDHILVQENGLQDMWSYFFPFHRCGAGGGVVAPSEQTPLGFGAAAAVGVAAAAPGVPVLALVGDGAFGIFAADLATAAENDAPVVYLVLCNGGYGWLQAEAQARGVSAHRFADAARPLPAVACPGVSTVVVEKAGMTAALAEIARLWRTGRTVVALVPVDLTDIPPGITEVLGGTTIHPPGRVGDDIATAGSQKE